MLEEQIRLNPNGKLNNKFFRFLLKSWQPTPSWRSTIIAFFVIGIVLVGFGIGLIIINKKIVEVSVRYDNICEGKKTCEFPINIPKIMYPPVFFYYELDNFYQNHRRYIKSRSNDQLNGKIITRSKADSDCDPVVTNAEMEKTKSIDPDAGPLDPEAIAYPCGTIARSFFTDTYKMYKGESTNNEIDRVAISEKGIAWPTDIENKFKNTNNLALQWIDMTDEHFIVWMRTAALPNFRKLWGRIQEPIMPGTYTIVVKNKYSVKEFGGKKHIIFSTSGPFGGKNDVLSISFFVVGGACLLMGVGFVIRWVQHSKKSR